MTISGKSEVVKNSPLNYWGYNKTTFYIELKIHNKVVCNQILFGVIWNKFLPWNPGGVHIKLSPQGRSSGWRGRQPGSFLWLASPPTTNVSRQFGMHPLGGCTTNFPLDAFALLYFAFSLSFFQRERGMSMGQGEFVLAKFEGWKGKFVVHPGGASQRCL